MSTHTFFSLCVPSPVATVQETKWDAEREKACINTYAHASASQICLQNLSGQQQNSPMADTLLGPNLDPKMGPKQRPKRRNENVIQLWTPFWGPPKMGSAIGEFRCRCPRGSVGRASFLTALTDCRWWFDSLLVRE